MLGKNIQTRNAASRTSTHEFDQSLPAEVKGTKRSVVKLVSSYPGYLIKRGSRGEEVKRIQRALSVTADGIFGVKTEAAVRNYQKRHQLTVDGVVGPKTWAQLFAA
nr:peptidoglycan-binding domain-containing protein [Sporolactobacillus kofuensis]